MDSCPKCHRKLLSQASARCNWCGELIEDAAYQQQAQSERAAYFEHDAERDALTLGRMESIQASNPVQRMLGPLRPSLWRKPPPPEVGRITGNIDPTTGIRDIPVSMLPGVPEPFQLNNSSPQAPLASNLPDSSAPWQQTPQAPEPPASQPWYASSGPDPAPVAPTQTSPSAPMPEWPAYSTPAEDGKEPTGRFEHLEIDPK